MDYLYKENRGAPRRRAQLDKMRQSAPYKKGQQLAAKLVANRKLSGTQKEIRQEIHSLVRQHGTKADIALLEGPVGANESAHKFRKGLASVAAELAGFAPSSSASRTKTTRKKTTRQRLKTVKRSTGKREDWNQKETTKWFTTLGEKIGNFEMVDGQVYAVIGQPIRLRAAYMEEPDEDTGIVWEITQVKGEPAVLQAHDLGTRGYDVVERHTGTLAQMKKKLAAISRRKPQSSGSSKRKRVKMPGGGFRYMVDGKFASKATYDAAGGKSSSRKSGSRKSSSKRDLSSMSWGDLRKKAGKKYKVGMTRAEVEAIVGGKKGRRKSR